MPQSTDTEKAFVQMDTQICIPLLEIAILGQNLTLHSATSFKIIDRWIFHLRLIREHRNGSSLSPPLFARRRPPRASLAAGGASALLPRPPMDATASLSRPWNWMTPPLLGLLILPPRSRSSFHGSTRASYVLRATLAVARSVKMAMGNIAVFVSLTLLHRPRQYRRVQRDHDAPAALVTLRAGLLWCRSLPRRCCSLVVNSICLRTTR